MRLTQFADYGLRVLLFLGCRPDERATTEEIANAYGISKAHLQKIVRVLGEVGAITLQRGRKGGLELAVAPAEISLGTVLRALQGETALVECFDPDQDTCVISPACGLKRPLARALEAFYASLDPVTLADVLPARRRRELGLLLGH